MAEIHGTSETWSSKSWCCTKLEKFFKVGNWVYSLTYLATKFQEVLR